MASLVLRSPVAVACQNTGVKRSIFAVKNAIWCSLGSQLILKELEEVVWWWLSYNVYEFYALHDV